MAQDDVIRIPQFPLDPNSPNSTCMSSNEGIENSPCNEGGWFVYGNNTADDESVGMFVAQALEPRQAVLLEPGRFIHERQAACRFIRTENWARTNEKVGTLETTLLDPNDRTKDMAIKEWREKDRLFLIHLYGGLKGPELDERMHGIVGGHFAYGSATIVRDPLTDDLRFDIEYAQVYGHGREYLVGA